MSSLAGFQAYTVEQVAEILQVGRDKVYCLLRTHQLRSSRPREWCMG
jgi:excisionase family DNA binding protein